MPTLAIYSRISDRFLKSEINTLKDQRMRGIECARINGYDKYEFFEDKYVSASKIPMEKRMALQSMLRQIEAGNIQGVYVKVQDRLARELNETSKLCAFFLKNRVKLYYGNANQDLADLNVELTNSIGALIANLEVKRLGGRVKDSLLVGVKEGRISGGLATYGYTKDENKIMIPHPQEAAVVKQIFEMAMQGKGTKVIAETLHEMGIPTKRQNLGYDMKYGGDKKVRLCKDIRWRDATVFKIMTNTAYIGQRRFKDEIYVCPAIVKPFVFEAVQAMMKERKKFMKTTDRWHYLLKGLIVCKKCGQGFHGRTREDRRDHQYGCSSNRQRKSFCGNRGVNIDYLNELVWTNLQELDVSLLGFYQWYASNGIVEDQKSFLLDLERDKAGADKKLDNFLDIVAEGSVSAAVYNEKVKVLNANVEGLRDRILEVQNGLKTLKQKDEILALIKDYIKQLKRKNLTDDEKSQLCRIFIKKIEVDWTGTQHEIRVHFRIDQLTEFRVAALNKIEYEKSGFAFKKSNIYQSHITIERDLTPFPDLNLGNLPPVIFLPTTSTKLFVDNQQPKAGRKKEKEVYTLQD